MFVRLSPEQHDTLEGIPEPSENTVLLGQDNAADLVAGAYAAGKLPHALLLAGPRGIGKATLAYRLAYHLLKHPSREAAPAVLEPVDPTSALFRQIAQGAHPAILHLTRPFDEKAKKFKTVVSVDEIRRVNRFLSMTSHDGSYRVVIVDAADDMNRSAANALLKSLEEPPSRTIFLLIAHSLGALLPTIRSRCQIVRLLPLQPSRLVEAMEAVGVPLPNDAVGRERLLARAGGSVRSAILLSAFRGLEILAAVDDIAASKVLDLGMAQRLAETVGGRDQEIRFDMMNDYVLDRTADAASVAAQQGRADLANGLSRAWEQMRIAITDTDTYNLDRKQHTLTLMLQLHETLRL